MHRRATFENKVSRKPSPDRNRAAREEELKPDLEVVQIGRAESFKAWEHGYPFRTVRWHFHPEYEIHYVVDTTGHFFVGDFIGAFEPGNLVLTGPNLPHNWVSDIAPGAQVAVRSRVVQFTEGFIADAMALIPELACFRDTLERSRRGVLFGRETSAEVMPLLRELVGVRGIRRVEVFLGVIGALNRAGDARTLTSASYQPDPSGFMSTDHGDAPRHRCLSHVRRERRRARSELVHLSRVQRPGNDLVRPGRVRRKPALPAVPGTREDPLAAVSHLSRCR
jgi:hypothetical protein